MTALLASCLVGVTAWGSDASVGVPKFELRTSGLAVARPTRFGAFFDVAGRRSVALGYENRAFEVWAYPLKLADDFRLSFRPTAEYPVDVDGSDVAVAVEARPEATLITYSHAAFTVRQTLFAPLDEPGIVILLDVRSSLPLTITASFRPRLRLMWPAGLMTGNARWDGDGRRYVVGEETKRYFALVGSPAARDLGVIPYQEEPRDLPIRFAIDVPLSEMETTFVAIVIAGSVRGEEEAKATYERLLSSCRDLYEKNVAHYEKLLTRTLRVETPEPRLDAAFAWAKVGIDKGLVSNPLLGEGLIAGFRSSGDSERPGFAWMFGRDALWTVLAADSYGDLELTRTALEFLRKFQRSDGKIPHEISQSASLLPWFTDYPYPWNSADATPLFVLAHGDLLRAGGDVSYLTAAWDSIRKAYRFTAATDTDGNGLVENDKFGHGWVEDGALHPAHEEIYMQGIWVEASVRMAEMASVMRDDEAAALAQGWAQRTRAAMEKTYWLPDQGFYAFATARPREKPPKAEPGPNRERRQARLEALAGGGVVDEDTVLPAVPLIWETLNEEHAQSEIDHLGSGAMATDWGSRIISNRSQLYNPLSYHTGSVWPLFTGWASLAAYRYGRPDVGYQALMANALLTSANAAGAVTELLSGDYAAPFGRSSHHQIWSQAMVAAPLVRGLLGIEVGTGGALSFAPQLPADWDHAAARGVRAGDGRYDFELRRAQGRLTIDVVREGSGASVTVAPAFPLDARIRSVRVDGASARFVLRRSGDVQSALVVLKAAPRATVVFEHDAGTAAYIRPEAPAPGAENQGLRVLRARAAGKLFRLVVEGRGGQRYALGVRTPRRLGTVPGVEVKRTGPDDWSLLIAFDGPKTDYQRREIALPLLD
jgi:glycogen debranching enzyme